MLRSSFWCISVSVYCVRGQKRGAEDWQTVLRIKTDPNDGLWIDQSPNFHFSFFLTGPLSKTFALTTNLHTPRTRWKWILGIVNDLSLPKKRWHHSWKNGLKKKWMEPKYLRELKKNYDKIHQRKQITRVNQKQFRNYYGMATVHAKIQNEKRNFDSSDLYEISHTGQVTSTNTTKVPLTFFFLFW